MTSRKFLGALVVAAAALTARAESVDADSVTLGAMAERADVVVVADAPAAPVPADERFATFRLVEALRGDAKTAEIRVLVEQRGRQPALHAGARYLIFLRSAGAGRFEPVALPWGMRDTTESDVLPLVDYTRRYAAALAAYGAVAKPADLLALLVESIASPSSGVPTCAGRDLVRHEELVASMTDAQRLAVDAALAAPRKGDADLAAIIDAAGVAGTSASDAALVARLLDPATRHLRMNITAALRRHARVEVVSLLASKRDAADAAQRADMVNALGRLDRREAEPFLLEALVDSEQGVRLEAAHSVGLLARAVRAPKDGVDVEAPREKLTAAQAPLVAALAAAKSDTEQRALVWALAQIDTQEAWAEMKRLRDEAKDARVRELCAYYVLHPGVELILER